MDVNGITSSYASASYQKTEAKSSKATVTAKENEVGVVYEKSENTQTKASATYTMDADTVNRLKSELQYKQSQFAGLVEKLLGKQGKKSNSILDLLKGLKDGSVQVDSATAAQAQQEISEDGYWGVKQTSDRLVEMAKALSGGDPDKADAMIAAMEKGFKQATKAFGGNLPDITRQTVDAATQKLNDWKASFNKVSEEE